ncbi:MAG: M1 family aminopeptidase [Fimbriiglobus sp.]
MLVRFWGLLLVVFVACIPASAAELRPPEDLPRYDLTVEIDPAGRLAQFRNRVTWTNTTPRPSKELVFNYYPMYRVPPGDSLLLAKTLELLRLDPSYGFDSRGAHGRIAQIRTEAGESLTYTRRSDNPTAFSVELPTEVGPGEKVTLEITGQIRLPEIQGRWGQWDGVTYLVNSMPTLAFYNSRGWHDVPFVPWHQPFWNEAGHYTAKITIPEDHLLACSAEVESTTIGAGGRKVIVTKPFVGRDFAMIASAKYREYKSDVMLPSGKVVQLKCLALQRHEFYAKEMLKIVAAALPVYSQWFGEFPYEQMTIAESYFGWNGNECAGLIMIDERVFDMPHLATGYVEYLVSHETCHQWWYNIIGTNGYSETFMDEGAATYFTHRFIDQKRGKNNPFLHWPNYGTWLPNIKRENYRYSSLYGAIRRNDAPAAAGPLPGFGHLIGLFSGAYDRGSKVFALIEERLGEQAFLDFTQELMKKYYFRVLSAEQLKAELIAYSGEQSTKPWSELFDRWVYDSGLTDWVLDDVKIHRVTPQARSGTNLNATKPVRVEVKVSQRREYDEPTTVGFQFAEGGGYAVRLPVGVAPSPEELAQYDLEVLPDKDGHGYTLRATLPSEPTQVVIDPDRVLLDSDPSNNSWNRSVNARVVPFYSFLYDTDLTNDYDRWNVTAGPWAFGQFTPDPWYTRTSLLGARIGAYRTQTFSGGAYAAIRPDFRDLVVGVDGLIDHWPWARTQVGFNVEQRVSGPWFDNNGEQTALRAVLFGRYVLQYGSSLYLPPMSYIDAYTTYQDNFLPFAREAGAGSQRPDWTWLNGIHYRLNLYTPYWDPERGGWLDVTYAGGVADLDGRKGTHQVRAEIAFAKKLPEGLGYLSDIKWVGRGVAAAAFPDNGQFFSLGGSNMNRGFDLAERQGSFLWLANAEARMPLFRDVRWNFADRIIGVRNVSLAPFYDVGAIYNQGDRIGNVVHTVGVGARIDLAFFSFIERATVRFDVGKSINNATPLQFWFGVQHPF